MKSNDGGRSPRPTLRPRDAWAKDSSLSAEDVLLLTNILELRGAQPRQIKMRETCFLAAGIRPGMRLVEFGCGSGVVCRHVSDLLGPDGFVLGVDVRDDFIRYAREIGRPLDGAPIEYAVGDALDRANIRSADCVMAVTLLAHVEDLDGVMNNMKSHLTQGGRMVLLDQDYQTLIFNHSDLELTETIVNFGARHSVFHPRIGRRLPELLIHADMQDVLTWSFVYAERDANSYLMTIANRFAQLAAQEQLVSEAEADGWIAELEQRGKEGTFFASLNYFCAWGSTS